MAFMIRAVDLDTGDAWDVGEQPSRAHAQIEIEKLREQRRQEWTPKDGYPMPVHHISER